MYFWLARSTLTVAPPGPLEPVKRACSCPDGQGVVCWSQICTTGERRGLNGLLKAAGAATIGGSQKKFGLRSVPCTASVISAEIASGPADVGPPSTAHATNNARWPQATNRRYTAATLHHNRAR